MKKYFLLFHRRKGQEKDEFSVVDESLLKSIPKDIIKVKKEFPNDNIIKTTVLKEFVESSGGVWYAN